MHPKEKFDLQGFDLCEPYRPKIDILNIVSFGTTDKMYNGSLFASWSGAMLIEDGLFRLIFRSIKG